MGVIWKDGEFLDSETPSVSHADSGLGNGLGVFDTMMLFDGVFIDLERHMARLEHDARVVLRKEIDAGEYWRTILQLVKKNELSGYVRAKTIVTGGIADAPLGVAAGPSVVMSVAPCADPESFGPVTCAVIRDYPRVAGCVLDNCKRLDYTRSYAARMDAKALGAEEAILTNTNGHIACGATSNLFIQEGEDLITPPLSDGVLAGISRAILIEGGGVREESIDEARLRQADAIYLTNSFIELRHIILI